MVLVPEEGEREARLTTGGAVCNSDSSTFTRSRNSGWRFIFKTNDGNACFILLVRFGEAIMW